MLKNIKVGAQMVKAKNNRKKISPISVSIQTATIYAADPRYPMPHPNLWPSSSNYPNSENREANLHHLVLRLLGIFTERVGRDLLIIALCETTISIRHF